MTAVFAVATAAVGTFASVVSVTKRAIRSVTGYAAMFVLLVGRGCG
jgi:hypothetical protein